MPLRLSSGVEGSSGRVGLDDRSLFSTRMSFDGGALCCIAIEHDRPALAAMNN